MSNDGGQGLSKRDAAEYLYRRSAAGSVERIEAGQKLIDLGAGPEDLERLNSEAEAEREAASRGVTDVVGILQRAVTSGPRFLTGIVALDERLSPKHDPSKHGLPLGRIVGIVAPPHAGKSVTVDQIAVAAARHGLRVVILVTDEPREDAAERIGQGFGFRHAELNADYPETLARLRGVEELSRLVVLPDEDVGPLTIEESAEILFAVAAVGYVLIVDSLHKSRSSAENETDTPRAAIEKRMAAIRSLRNKGALVIFTAEGNRASYASSDLSQRVTAMASAAESRAIEFGSDLLLVLRRDGDDVHVEVPKNRIGRRYESFTMRLHAGSASFHSVTEEAVTMEKEGRRAERLHAAEGRIVELLKGVPDWLSASAIEKKKLGNREDVRIALQGAVRKGRLRSVPNRRGSGSLYQIPACASGSPGSPEVRRGFAGEGVETLGGGSPPPYKGRRTASLDEQMQFHESTENGEPTVTVQLVLHPDPGDDEDAFNAAVATLAAERDA